MKTTRFKLGDVVRGSYHGVPYQGVLSSFDGSGYLYVDFPAPFEQPAVYGTPRDGITIGPGTEERDAMRLVSRPETPPRARPVSSSALGGVSMTR